MHGGTDTLAVCLAPANGTAPNFVRVFSVRICTEIYYLMKFVAEIDIMPLPTLLDRQGKAVGGTMKSMDLPEIVGVRIGKHVTLVSREW